MISEKDFVLETFRENFSDYKNRKIVLYGIGFNTRIILEGCSDFNIVGLMDWTKAGETIYNKRVLSYDEVIEQEVDAIIVIARSNSAKIIYRRIRDFCSENNIPLFDINKNNLFELFDSNSLVNENETYFQVSEAALKKQIDAHEIISFDVFDTLIMRKVLYPIDVFDLVEKEIKIRGLSITNFKKHRMDSERELFLETNPTIYEIYDYLQSNTAITDNEKDLLMQIELDSEKKVLIKRHKMVEIMEYAINQGKNVFLISDMYLPKTILEDILGNLGITGYKELLVSCDYRVPKCNGLFEVFKEKIKSDSYLHIGDNSDADELYAKRSGMDTFVIKSAVDMLEVSSYKGVFEQFRSINDRSLVGLFISKVFNNPFVLHQTKGRVEINEVHDVGYLFVAPIITNFIVWLLKAVKKENFDNILFAARDGYLMQKLYDLAVKLLKMDDMPKGLYFLTSRMICAASSMKSDEDIVFVASLPFAYSPEKLLRIRFGLEKDDILPFDHKLYNDIGSYALAHKDKIFEKSAETRENYLKYIDSLEIKNGGKVALFDFVSTGTCQMYLTDLLPCDIKGLYFLHYLSDSTRKNQLDINALFENGFTYQVQSYTFENYNFLETVVTSFDPSLSRFDENMQPIYRPETREDNEIQYLSVMHKAITEYFKDYIVNLYNIDESINEIISEKLFSFMDRKFSEINCSDLKNLVLLDDFGVGKIEVIV